MLKSQAQTADHCPSDRYCRCPHPSTLPFTRRTVSVERLNIQIFFLSGHMSEHVYFWYFNLTCLQKYTQVQTHVHIAQGSLKITYCCIRSVHASTRRSVRASACTHPHTHMKSLGLTSFVLIIYSTKSSKTKSTQ